MKVFIATLGTETNTFAPLPTQLSDFWVERPADLSDRPVRLYTEALSVWRNCVAEKGWTIVESIAAFAQPSGVTIQTAYESLRNEILSDLHRNGGADVILIQGHGAMVSENCDDCEGELLSQLRSLSPNAIIAMLLDPHCHLTEKMMEAADLLICFKEYPHSDASARAEELFSLAAATVEGTIQPEMRDFDCQIVNIFMTTHPPLRRFVDSMMKDEGKDNLLSVSLIHGFPWGDTERTGTRVLAISDRDGEVAERAANYFGRELIRQRNEFCPNYKSIDQVLDEIQETSNYPIVLADMADNPGGGAPSDSTFLLKAALDRGHASIAAGIFYDPEVVIASAQAGIGKSIDVQLGGKHGAVSGIPINFRATVRGHIKQLDIPMGNGSTGGGEAVWLSNNSLDLIVSDKRIQCLHPDAFLKFGVPLHERKLILVKSTNHFFDSFSPLAGEIFHVATPGALSYDFASLPFRKRNSLYWPRVAQPWD